jgi:hypothetical protein
MQSVPPKSKGNGESIAAGGFVTETKVQSPGNGAFSTAVGKGA